MKETGIVRKIDELGRFVIPKEIRAQLKVENNRDSFEIFVEGDKVILKKYQPSCAFCENTEDLVEFSGYNVCTGCIEKLNATKDIKENI